jgi:hypothetical protein
MAHRREELLLVILHGNQYATDSCAVRPQPANAGFVPNEEGDRVQDDHVGGRRRELRGRRRIHKRENQGLKIRTVRQDSRNRFSQDSIAAAYGDPDLPAQRTPLRECRTALRNLRVGWDPSSCK